MMEFRKVRALLYRWAKTNSVIFINAGSLIGTTVVTSLLGFAYWWIAARQFTPEAVGLGSATISAMTLLATACLLGLGTLLIGELPRQPGKEGPLISTALLVVGGAGGCAGAIFALVAPFVAIDFQVLRANVQNVLLFTSGVSLTAITLVLDQALTGLLRSGLQLWRNAFFAVTKLVALFIVSLWIAHRGGMLIYITWLVSSALSLVMLIGFVVLKKGWSRKTYRPQWDLLRKLGPAALQHHIFNLLLQLPYLVLPVLVTTLLSAAVNAWFYVSFMIAYFIYATSYALTIVLYAVSSAHPAVLIHKARLTLILGVVAAILANVVLLFTSRWILGIFGRVYVEQAEWGLHILALGAFPIIIKQHYSAICRIQGRILQALLPITVGTLIELGAAAAGAQFGGLSGLSLGWVAALCAEAVYMSPTVYRAVLGEHNVREQSVAPATAPSIDSGD
jgi:O-antigen/teichoic acid export membrane protein